MEEERKDVPETPGRVPVQLDRRSARILLVLVVLGFFALVARVVDLVRPKEARGARLERSFGDLKGSLREGLGLDAAAAAMDSLEAEGADTALVREAEAPVMEGGGDKE